MNDDAIRILDRICPSEADLPPSQRTWARMIRVPSVPTPVLELRDPNHGLGHPDGCPRHQYTVARGRLWSRRLAPAPLEQPQDETPFIGESPRWRLAAPAASRRGIFALPNPTALPWEWAMTQGVAQYPVEPLHTTVTANLDGTGAREYPAYAMPPADPVNMWCDITGVPCPVPGCVGQLTWAEAGYAPGHRVCVGGPYCPSHAFVLRCGLLVHYRTDDADPDADADS